MIAAADGAEGGAPGRQGRGRRGRRGRGRGEGQQDLLGNAPADAQARAVSRDALPPDLAAALGRGVAAAVVASELTSPSVSDDPASPDAQAGNPMLQDAPDASSSLASDGGELDEALRPIRFDEAAPAPAVYNEAAASADDALAADAPEAIEETALVDEPEVVITPEPAPANDAFERDVIPPPPVETVAAAPTPPPAPAPRSFASHFEQVETRFPPPPADVVDEPLPPAEAVPSAVTMDADEPQHAAAQPEREPESESESEQPTASPSQPAFEQVETRRDD
ncbi:MAG: hypothetical protein ACREUE_03185 [Panacagrimonas sp.]